MDDAIQLRNRLRHIGLGRAVEPDRAFLSLDPSIRCLQRTHALHHVVNVVVVRHDHMRLKPINGVMDLMPAHRMARAIDRQQRDIDLAQHVPNFVRRIVAVVSLVDDPQAARLDNDQAVVLRTGIVGRRNIDPIKIEDNFLEIINRRARIRLMLVRDALDRDISERVSADQSVDEDMGMADNH